MNENDSNSKNENISIASQESTDKPKKTPKRRFVGRKRGTATGKSSTKKTSQSSRPVTQVYIYYTFLKKQLFYFFND